MPVTYVVLSVLLGAGIQQDVHCFGEILPDCGSAACACRAGHLSRLLTPARCKAGGTCPLPDAAKAEAAPQKDSHKRQNDAEPKSMRRVGIVRKAFLRQKCRRQQCESCNACRRPLRRLRLRCRH